GQARSAEAQASRGASQAQREVARAARRGVQRSGPPAAVPVSDREAAHREALGANRLATGSPVAADEPRQRLDPEPQRLLPGNRADEGDGAAGARSRLARRSSLDPRAWPPRGLRPGARVSDG